MGWWSALWKQQASEWIFKPLSHMEAPVGPPRQTLEPDHDYLSVHLRSLGIPYVRKGVTKFFGAVHSNISFASLNAGRKNVQVLTVPAKLRDLDAANVDRVIAFNQRLLGPVPYRGGDIEIELGLFSVRSVDLAEPFLSMLEKVSSIAGVSYITAAMPFAEILKSGVDVLTQSDRENILEVGLSGTLMPAETGTYLIVRAPRSTQDNYRLNTDFSIDYQGAPVPYMVLTVDSATTRDAWFEIPELRDTYSELQSDVRRGNVEMAKESFGVFKRTVRTSPDLLFGDANSLIEKVDTVLTQTLEASLTSSRRIKPSLPELATIPLYS